MELGFILDIKPPNIAGLLRGKDVFRINAICPGNKAKLACSGYIAP